MLPHRDGSSIFMSSDRPLRQPDQLKIQLGENPFNLIEDNIIKISDLLENKKYYELQFQDVEVEELK